MGDFSPLLTCTRATEETMNSSLMILLVVGVALLGWAEADCNDNGCCFCHQDEGYVITHGDWKEACDRRYKCRCNHDRNDGYYGECVPRRWGSTIARGNRGRSG